MPDDVVGDAWSLALSARAAQQLDLARQALQCRDLQGATIELEELLDEEPEHPDALSLLAATCVAQRDWHTARHALRSLHGITGGTVSTWTQLAQAELECWDFPAAEEAARAAIERQAECGEAWHLLGLLTERRGQLAQADEHHLRAWRISPLLWPLPFRLDAAGWEELVYTAMDSLDEALHVLWSDVPIHLEPFPTRSPLPGARFDSPRELVRYDGDPEQDDLPAALRVFWGNLAHTGSVELLIDALLSAIDRITQDWLAPPEALEE